MKITKERFLELGLGCQTDCEYLMEDGKCDYCGCECPNDPLKEAPCVDEDRLKTEMTYEEYYAWRHNRLNVE